MTAPSPSTPEAHTSALRVALLSPLPPAATGVAEYSSRLGLELARLGQQRGIESHAAESPDAVDLDRYDARLFQIGNNGLHASIYQAALSVPGIVVLHDAVLHHLLLGVCSRETYIEEFAYNYGDWFRHLAEQLWRQRACAEADERYFAYPMLRRLIERSQAVVVHNPKAKRLVLEAARQAAATVNVFEIPHFVEPPEPPSPQARTEARRQLGVPEEAVLISCFGYLRPSKRVRSLLEASRRLPAEHRLLLAGNFVSRDYEESLQPLLAEPRVIRLPYVPQEKFWQLAAATDICVNLRYPSAGETSGIAVKLMAIGKPVVVTQSEELSALPDVAAIRVEPGEAEVDMLAEYLQLLAVEPEMRSAIGQKAAQHMREHHAVDRVAGCFLEVIERVARMALRK
jgi:glycosyltransferase involved in cell wall biosynthesis